MILFTSNVVVVVVVVVFNVSEERFVETPVEIYEENGSLLLIARFNFE